MVKQIFYIIVAVILGIAVGGLIYLFCSRIEEPIETMTIRVFFSNKYEDPDALACDEVYFAEREVPKSQTPTYTALEELLKGPTDLEKESGFLTSINAGVKIQSLSINDAIAMVDFDEKLDQDIAGSCTVLAIRAQITETLKQFSEIEEVIISIDGRTEDILQP